MDDTSKGNINTRCRHCSLNQLQVINTYCYIMSTFTLPRALAGDVGKEVAAPGVGAYDSKTDTYTVKVSITCFQKDYFYFSRLTISGFPLYCFSRLVCSMLLTYYVKCGREERLVQIMSSKHINIS